MKSKILPPVHFVAFLMSSIEIHFYMINPEITLDCVSNFAELLLP